MATFFETITAAINDLIERGYQSEEQITHWTEEIRAAAERDMIPEHLLNLQLQRYLAANYTRMIDRGGILSRHPGIDRFTLDKLRPSLRAELDKRIVTSARLIKLNREQMIAETMRRFEGWATSVPAGGTDVTDRRAVKDNVRKALASLPFTERRVMIDQGHKLNAALSEIIAEDQDAIAAEWHSHWRQAGYNYRVEHKERDGVFYAMRDSWAVRKRLIAAGPQGYYQDSERPGEFVFCRCYVRWLYNLRDLPKSMLTATGAAALAAVQAKKTAAA